jgi:FKBP-type peptidyl-prolyl cis-trans isomerase SlyD
MTQGTQTVTNNVVVSIEYVLTLDDGQEIDRSEVGAPLEYLHGHGQIIPGLEQELTGLSVGAEKQVVVAPEDGYGEYDDNQVQTMPRDAFPPEADLTEGELLNLQDEESGHIFQAQVVESDNDEVVLDFNHPLAGETLHFQVKIVGVRAATPEELAHGHAHGAGHDHH